MHELQEYHMEASMKIVQYINSTPGRGIVFRKNGHLNVEAFTDADWTDNPNDRQSTGGYLTQVGGNLDT